MNQDTLLRILRAAALAVVNECDTISSAPAPSTPAPVGDGIPEAPKPKATRAKKETPAPAATAPAPEQPDPTAPDTMPEQPASAPAPAPSPKPASSKATLEDLQAYAYSIGKVANGGVSTEAGTKARNWIKKNFNVEGIGAVPNVADNYDRVLEMLIKVGATDSRLPAPTAPEDEL